MRVLHVYRTYFPDTQGGVEEVIRQICLNTKIHNIEYRVFTLSASPSPLVIQRREAEIHRCKLNFEIASCGFSVNSMREFKSNVDWADVIHYHFPWPFADLLHFANKVKKPSIVTYHSDIVRQKGLLLFYRPLMRLFLDHVGKIVATSDNYFAASKELKRFARKVEVIPLGITEESFPDVKEHEVEKLRDQIGCGFFLFVGVLRYYKGLHVLIDAIKGTTLQCVIAGAGPIEDELKRYASDYGLTNITFLGRVSDETKMSLMRLCRAVVLPSHLRSEAFGVTLLEGAMSAKPLISTEIGTGTSYVNIDGETGFVVPPGDVNRLRDSMCYLDRDKALAERMGKAARARYEAHFTGEKMGEKYASLYFGICNSK